MTQDISKLLGILSAYSLDDHQAFLQEIADTRAGEILAISDLFPEEKTGGILSNEKMVRATRAFIKKNRQLNISTAEFDAFVKHEKKNCGVYDFGVEDAPVYQWVSDQADRLGYTVNARGKLVHEEHTQIRFTNDLVVLDSTADQSQRFHGTLIGAAIETYKSIKGKQAEEALRQHIGTARAKGTIDDAFAKLVLIMRLGTNPDSAVSPELSAKILLKFIWQVKRKLNYLPITNHLMVVLVGGEGSGKTVFVEKMTAPMRDMRVALNFAELTDSRSIDIFGALVGVIDEMAKADKADVETLKNIITAETVTRRPMRTNADVDVRQRLSLIGTSNKDVAEMILDDTSNRRLFQIDMINKEDERKELFWEAVNTMDWLELWRCVDQDAADPTKNELAEIVSHQIQARNLSKVEQWMIAQERSIMRLFKNEEVVSSSDLFPNFNSWCHTTNNFLSTMASFQKELARVCKTRTCLLQRSADTSKKGYKLRKEGCAA